MSTTVHRTKVVPPGFADVTQEITLTGDPDPYLITYGVSPDPGPFDQGDAVNLRNLYVGQFQVFLNPTTFIGPLTMSVGQAVGDPLIFTAAGSTAGTNTPQETAPPNVALLIVKNTALGGRRNKGRMYFPAVFIPDVSVSSLGAVSIATFQTELDDWLAGIALLNDFGSMVVFHSYEWTGDEDPGPPPGFPAPTSVTSLVVQPMVATQRRRLRN